MSVITPSLEYLDDAYIKFVYEKKYSTEEFIQIHNDLVALQAECPNKAWLLVDTRKMGPLSKEKQEHVVNDSVPKMAKQAGRKMRIALLLGDDVFASFGAKAVAEKSNESSVSKYFSDEKRAIAWLKENSDENPAKTKTLEFVDETYIKFVYEKNYELKEFKEAHEALLKLQSECPTKDRLLVDTRKMGPMSEEKQEILVSHTIPKLAEQAGGRVRVARLMGEDVFSNFGANIVAQKTTDLSMSKDFSDENEAVDWLTEGIGVELEKTLTLEFSEDSYIRFAYQEKSTKEEFETLHKDLVKFQKTCPKKNRLMVNTSKMGVLSLDQQGFITNKIIPQMATHAGEKMRIALILGDDVFASFSAKNVVEKSDEVSATQCFSNEEDAAAWLKESV
ncbi:hypothetical protein FUAX_51390 (plasmid) [Fulvitalea axinellae]|uniref:DUF4180 domain-containing protein n=1 Tax=Fulvitalea axinellae TaxID=1182444 RepID=A0AAU9D0M4_9BACT|nr:hypothetical protein FUAX_51390 [Fulvitalea axinellae]